MMSEAVQSDDEASGRYFSSYEKVGYYNSEIVYLNAGGPGTELLRMLPPIIEAATSYQMHQELEKDAQLFQYGIEGGNWQFRSFLATFLSEEYGDLVNCNNLFLTGGASSGLWLVCSCLLSPGRIVFIEDPSYFVAPKIFSDLGLKLVPVKTDHDGILIEDFEEKLRTHLSDASLSSGVPSQALLYLIPVFQNPTGALLSKDRCQKLIQLARKFGVMVVCDDVYNLLYYDDSCPVRLFAYDDKHDANYAGNVISNCSFSKILGPGLRIGWLEAPTWVIDKLNDFGVLKSGGGLNIFTSGIITSLIALGKMKSHLEKVRNIYKTHMEATAELLREELPTGSQLLSSAKGGYFLWIQLPTSVDASQLLLYAFKEYKISFTPGKITSVTGGFSNYIRLCISFYPLNILLSATRKLCLCIAEFQLKSEQDESFLESLK